MTNPVLAKADDELVLILDYCWMPLCITTVKEGIKKLYSYGLKHYKNPKVRAINRVGEPMCWDDWINPGKALYFENQPYIASPNHLLPVPTILLTTSHFYHHSKKMPTLGFLYKKLKGTCQICGNHYPQNQMTREHIYPKALGGTLDWYNTTMTCIECNCKKRDIFPYYNHKGEELKGVSYMKLDPIFIRVNKRPEWKDYIFRTT